MHAQEQLIKELNRLFEIFINSECEIKPHFILTGSSGSGKSHTIQGLCEDHDIGYIEVNAAQLTKEGTSGNSLSKALAPLANMQGMPSICFVDEFDKLFISGNSNTDTAHETTNGVQNEFLKVLESSQASVFGDYGKYVNIDISNTLFIFAGAFNGVEDITLDDLRGFGLKTEFLGRVGLNFHTEKLTLEVLINILKESPLLEKYLELFEDVDKADAEKTLIPEITKAYDMNTLGVRMIHTLIHQYFIKGKEAFIKQDVKPTFKKKLSIGK